MTNEKRLIDANALEKDMRAYADNKAYCGHIELANGILKAVGRIDEAPTVDAVSVVRCCDCVSCKVILDNVGAGHWHCKKRYGLPEVDPTDFCSYGERREGE